MVTDELSPEISVMYFKQKAAAMHTFRLNGWDTAQPATPGEGFHSVVGTGCSRVLGARSKDSETQYPVLRQIQQKWRLEASVELPHTA